MPTYTPTGPLEDERLLIRYRDLGDGATVAVANISLRMNGCTAFGYTARLGKDLADKLCGSGKERDRLRTAMTKNFKAALGRQVADVFTLETTPKTWHLHIHGTAGLYAHEEDAAKEAIGKSVGEWASTFHTDKQVHMEPLYSFVGWALYQGKDAYLTQRFVSGQLYSLSQQCTRQAKALWAHVRELHRADVIEHNARAKVLRNEARKTLPKSSARRARPARPTYKIASRWLNSTAVRAPIAVSCAIASRPCAVVKFESQTPQNLPTRSVALCAASGRTQSSALGSHSVGASLSVNANEARAPPGREVIACGVDTVPPTG